MTTRQVKFEIPLEIKSAAINERRGTTKGGRAFTIREQHGWVHIGKDYPQEISMQLDNDQAPFPPGDYVIDQRSLYVDRFGQLAIGRLKITPVMAEAAAARAS